MIVIEPPPNPSRTGRPGRRDLERFLALAIKTVPVKGAVSVLLTSDQAIMELNRRFRQKNKPTDVLSFPAGDLQGQAHGRIAGDLAISLDTASRQAEEFDHALDVELKILILHGLLHLAGLDHEVDAGEMARRELELRTQLDLPAGLIQRSSPNPKAKRRTVQVGPLGASGTKGRKPRMISRPATVPATPVATASAIPAKRRSRTL